MFFAKNKATSDTATKPESTTSEGGKKAEEEKKVTPESVTEYIERKFPKQKSTFKTILDKEIDEEVAKIDQEVDVMIQRKVREFSFEIKSDMAHFPEIDQLAVIIDKSIEDYKLSKKFG